MVAEEWVEVVALYLSELVTGSAALKAVVITTSRRMLAVCDVGQAVQVLPLSLILGILLQWILPRTMVWAQARWLVLQGQVHLPLLLVDLDLEADTVDNNLVALLAPSLYHLVSELPLVLTQGP